MLKSVNLIAPPPAHISHFYLVESSVSLETQTIYNAVNWLHLKLSGRAILSISCYEKIENILDLHSLSGYSLYNLTTLFSTFVSIKLSI